MSKSDPMERVVKKQTGEPRQTSVNRLPMVSRTVSQRRTLTITFQLIRLDSQTEHFEVNLKEVKMESYAEIPTEHSARCVAEFACQIFF